MSVNLLALTVSQYLPNSGPVQPHLTSDLSVAPPHCAQSQDRFLQFHLIGIAHIRHC